MNYHKKIKILYVLEAMGGGTKKVLDLLVANMDRDRFDISLALPPPKPYDAKRPLHDPKFPDVMGKKGFRVYTVGMEGRRLAPLANFKAMVRLCRIIRSNKFDVVHSYSSIAGFIGRFAARLANVPVIIYSPEGFAFNEFIGHWKDQLYKLIERVAGYLTNSLIACSETERQQAIEAKVIAPSKLTVIGNPLDTENYDIERLDVLAKKKDLDLSLNAPIVGTVARLSPQKGPRYLVEAAAYVLKFIPECQFILVGDGELRQEVEELIDRLKIEHSIHLLGNRKDYLEIMATFDVFVLSSLWEGLPYIPLEAMLLRKPVIATAITGSKDIVEDSTIGVLVPPKNPIALANAIVSLLQNPQRARVMGIKAERNIRQRFSISSSVAKHITLYEALLSNRRRYK